MELHEIRAGMLIKGLLPSKMVTIITVVHHGSIGAEIAYKDGSGQLGSEIIYAETAQDLEVVSDQLPWSYAADGPLFRLVSEAYRIHLAYLFDPLLAVHTSLIDPLPHQITAVYEAMLRKQPLRYLLADDPGSGKTIMTGLLIKELMIRGDLHRCLIVTPGNLVEQWQDELHYKFHLVFDILTNDRIEASATSNAFTEMPLCIARLDKLSRDERVQHMLQQTEWDLVVVDEAHKMSATFFGGEIKYTKRYQLGQMLSKIARHFVLLTATPHNGKEEDFQLFLRLLDEDRFEGRFRTGVHKVDVSDLMRHLVKEQLYTFDATPLFPERLAYTLNYQLSEREEALYQEVTDYVRREFNRADALGNNGRKGTVGFALTILQRRLASSPEAIYQSLRRRRERLEQRLREERQAKHNEQTSIEFIHTLPLLTEEDFDDLDDIPVTELEATEDSVVDQASAARTIAELQAEIDILKRLESLALHVRRSGMDRKWEELASLLQNNAEMFDVHHHRLKLVIFTEHRDTLNYLTERINIMLGGEGAVVTIHGGLRREERSKAQQAFTQDKDVNVLIATDAAGEGINLQRAHLMVNYDLPWNPNRLEQRFGRIHRIGQTEVCHLWNLVAAQTREGEVFHTLLKKLEEEREALGGQVFDVLGKVLFDERPLRDLMVEAIRYGDRPDVRARLTRAVDHALDRQHLQALLEEQALAREVMDVARVHQIRAEMERATARRLQPHFIASFFLDALKRLGGKYYRRENQRYEITYIPSVLRSRRSPNDLRATILRHYERVVFEKELVHVPGKPQAELICPGHPLLDVTIDVILEQYQDLLKQGTVLVDPKDTGETTRVLFYLEHTIQDARFDANGKRHPVSRQLQFVELNERGEIAPAGYAPFLDYRPPEDGEIEMAAQLRQASWLNVSLEEQARTYAIRHLVPRHLEEVKQRREEQISKTEVAVRERLVKEIGYWSNRSAELRLKEAAGKTNTHLNSQKARQTAEELSNRLEKRLEELQQERRLSPLPPNIIGGLLVVPIGLLNKLRGIKPEEPELAQAHETERVEQLAMQAIMEAERRLGYIPRDVSADKCGYDIESSIPNSGRLRFIEVKGRAKGATTVTITRNEIMTGLNKPEDFILAVVIVDGEQATPYYITHPFHTEPDFNATSVNYDLPGLFNRGVIPDDQPLS